MRRQRHGWIRRRALSLARIAALTGTLTLHIVVFAQLWLTARVVPQQRMRSAITVELYQPAVPPPVEPLQIRPAPPVAITVKETTPIALRDEPVAAVAPPDPDEPEREFEFVPAPLPAASLEQQRANVAAEIARENAPARRPFRGRSIDAMLPDGDKGMLPGFRPRVSEGARGMARGLAGMLSRGVPTAATDPDAPTDLLTEGWEAAHHGSDLAGCELQYKELDADLRRQMCGEVGPGQ